MIGTAIKTNGIGSRQTDHLNLDVALGKAATPSELKKTRALYAKPPKLREPPKWLKDGYRAMVRKGMTVAQIREVLGL